MKFTKEDARKRVLNCAKQYQQNLLHKKLLIIFRERQDNSIRFIEIIFHERNYQHLTGLELTNTEGKILQHQSKNFYRKCIENKLGLNDVDKVMGGVNFCLGLSRENDVFVPSSALLEDIKKLTSSPSQVLAIFEKDIDSELYSTVKHVAKGLNLHHLILPPEISSKISPPTTIPINITGKKITVQSNFIIPQDAFNPNIKNFPTNQIIQIVNNNDNIFFSF